MTADRVTAPRLGRRQFLGGVIGALAATAAQTQTPRRFRIAFANLNEEPSVHIEGLGFTGADVRRSFELAARTLPVEMIYYDNGGYAERALANAADAITRKVDLYIAYCADQDANAEIARKMQSAGIPVLAVNDPVPGAPLYAADNVAAGRIAGGTLGEFARENWSDQVVLAVIAGDLGDSAPYLAERIKGITEGLNGHLPDIAVTMLDTSGNPVRLEGLLAKFLASQTRRRVVISALDDPTALAAKGAVERAGRTSECVIVGLGLDRSVHGGASEKKEIDPNNRGSIVLGSVAFYLDRYGYEILPLALKKLGGGEVPPLTKTRHVLVSSRNVFTEYPPTDMN